ncbi:MAG TPA: pitrilysin family protein [Thermoplasmata archaeon]|nr:pitrilysin family protein [Thermoplasmata archaeon]
MREAGDPLRVEYGAELDGLRVVRHAPPPGAASFSATYVGPAGWAFDPPGRAGVSRIVNQLVVAAAGPYDRVGLARALDRAGATIAHQSSPESSEMTVWGPATEWKRLVGLLAEVVLRPRFDPADLARVRRQMLERQLRELAQPSPRADRELLRAIFPEGHPFRDTGVGDRRSLARISRGDLVRFHQTHYTSADAVLVVTTPASLGAVERLAREKFRRFASSTAARLSSPSVPPPRKREVTVDLPGRSQVEVRVGGASVARTDPMFPATFLANEVLGGRPLLSRLFQRVRERSGLAYHASSSLEAMGSGGYWVAHAGTGADRWRKVVPMLAAEVARLGREGVRPQELAVIRESAIGEIPLAVESTAEAHELAVDLAYHALPPDYWVRWPTTLRALRPEEVRSAAEQGLDRSRSVTVVVGPVGRHR